MLGLFVRKLGKKVKVAAKKGLEAQGELQRTTNEALSHIRVVKTNNAEERECERFAVTTAEQLRQELRVRKGRSMSTPLAEMVASLVLGGLAVVMADRVLNHGQDAGTFIGALAALALAANNLRPLTMLYTELQATAAGATRLRELLRLERDDAHDAGKPSLLPHRESLELRDVTLTYPGASVPSLRGVSLRVKHGETVAIVGPNGSGKTTLLSLLPRVLEPDVGSGGVRKGVVLIDGVDVSTVTLASLRKQIGVVTQETALFKGSIFWNIAYGVEGGVSEERVKEAARKARAEEFIQAKPGGYEFEIGEGGAGVVWWSASAVVHRAGGAARPVDPDPGRGDEHGGRGQRTSDRRCAGGLLSRADVPDRGAPAEHGGARGPDRGDEPRGDRGCGDAPRAAGAERDVPVDRGEPVAQGGWRGEPQGGVG